MFSFYNFRSFDCLSILSWVLYRERHYGFRTFYWRDCLFSNVFLTSLLRGCSCKAFSDSGFHTVLYWSTYRVLCFCYYGSYSSLKSGIVVPIALFFLLFFFFWDNFSSFGKKILILWWRLNWVCKFNNTKLSNAWTWEVFAVFVL